MRVGFSCIGAVALAALAFGAPAGAADGNRVAYDYAMRCFTASAVALNRAADNPGGTRTTEIREKASHAYDVAYKMGGILGFSDKQISADFDHAQAIEARLLTGEPDYYARTKADCIKLGLM